MTSKRMSRTGVSSSKPKGSSTRIKGSDRHSSLHAHGGKTESSSHSNSHNYSHSQGHNPGHVSGHSNSSKGAGSSNDRGGGSGSYNSSSRSRNRMHGNDSSNNYHHSSYGHSSSSRSGGAVKNRRFIDPNILAQGMSGRYLGARLSALKHLSSDELEKDLRLMDAYNAACISYAQRYFAFCNQNSNNNNNNSHGNVQLRNYKGGEAYTNMMVNSGDPLYSTEQMNDGVYCAHPTTTFPSINTGMSNSGYPAGTGKNAGAANANTNMPIYFPLPIKIDPEEEKRIAILRKKIAASEAKREVLETQYLSLRAHYVHESQATKRARDRLDGEMKLFKELIKKRGDVLALRRVRCAAARDILHCLKYRIMQNEMINAGDTKNNTDSGNPIKDSNSGVNNRIDDITSSVDISSYPERNIHSDRSSSGKDNSNNDKSSLSKQYQHQKPPKKLFSSESTNLKSFWKKLENEIRQAEKATSLIETPATLKLSTPALGENNSSYSNSKQQKSKNSNSSNNSSSSGRNKINYDDDVIMPSPSSSSQKNNHSTSSQNKRTKSPTRGDENSVNAIETLSTSSRKKLKISKGEREKYSKKSSHHGNSNSNSFSNDYLSTDIVGKENNIDAIPWVSQTMPTTPYGVPLLISYLSHAPDRIMGAALSLDPKELTFLESNLPESYNPTLTAELKQAEKLRHEIGILTNRLALERQMNNNLQLEIINDRKRSDAMCAMMTLIRTETEAVLRRHNIILGTPDARLKAADLHKKAKESAENEDEEGETEEETEEEEEDEEDDIEENNRLATPTEITVSAGGGEDAGGIIGDENDELEDEADDLEDGVDVDMDADGEAMDTDEEEGEIKEDDELEVESGDEAPRNTPPILMEAKLTLQDDDISQNEVQEDDDIVDEEEEAMSINNTMNDASGHKGRERVDSVTSSALDMVAAPSFSQRTDMEVDSDSAEEGEIQEDDEEEDDEEDEEEEEGEIQEDNVDEGSSRMMEEYQPIKEVIVPHASHPNSTGGAKATAPPRTIHENKISGVEDRGNTMGAGIVGSNIDKLSASGSRNLLVSNSQKHEQRKESDILVASHHSIPSEPSHNPFDDEDDDDDDEIAVDVNLNERVKNNKELEEDEEEEGEINEEEEGEVHEEEEEEEGEVHEDEKGEDDENDKEEGEVHEDDAGGAMISVSKFVDNEGLDDGRRI